MRKNFKHANAQAFTQTGLYTEACTQKFFTQMRQMLLHTEAFEHRCLYTQKHLPRDALTYTRLYTQKLLDTDCSERITEALTLRSLYTENLLHTEGFTHTQAFPQKLLHREAFTHRSFYTQTPLHTEACTHGGFYAQKLLHREAFTQTLSHRKTDSTEQLLHASKNRNLTQVFDVRPSYRAKGLHLALENRKF